MAKITLEMDESEYDNYKEAVKFYKRYGHIDVEYQSQQLAAYAMVISDLKKSPVEKLLEWKEAQW